MRRILWLSLVVWLTSALVQAAPAGRGVSFTTSDGVQLAGTAFGDGTVGIVLSHMFPTNQTSWFPFARRLAAEGYRALAYDFRGYGKSTGSVSIAQIDRDVRAAAKYLREQGVGRLVLIGASMGGTASMKVAAADGAAALVVLSSPDSFRGLSVRTPELARLTMPSLWVTAADDSVATVMRNMYARVQGSKSIHVYAGDAHGTYLFDSPYAADLITRLLGFLKQYAPPR